MIISHSHKFIFVAVPKTGTHSVRQALRPSLDQNDLEQVGLFVQKRLPFPELSDLGHGHLSAQQIRPVLGEKRFASYFKFAFVRNPFDRFVSYCAFMSRQSDVFETQPQVFMRHVLRDMQPTAHILFRPQHEFLCDHEGSLLMNFVGRVEHLQRDYDAICNQTGIASTALGQVNASKHRSYVDYYDDELIGLVGDLYQRDIELFGYRFDSPATIDPLVLA
ncbi:MAG: sulfotransferase family 2 domain-containing protein [Dokdonella sp.]